MDVQTKTAFVVVEIGWEYNDEFYYRGESGGGTPRKIYLDKVNAQTEADRLNTIEKAKPYHERTMTEDYDDELGEYQTIKEYFEIVEVEIAS